MAGTNVRTGETVPVYPFSSVAMQLNCTYQDMGSTVNISRTFGYIKRSNTGFAYLNSDMTESTWKSYPQTYESFMHWVDTIGRRMCSLTDNVYTDTIITAKVSANEVTQG